MEETCITTAIMCLSTLSFVTVQIFETIITILVCPFTHSYIIIYNYI